MSQHNWLQALQWDESHISELRMVAYAYIRQGHYATALPFFEALVVLQPNSVYDLQTLGALYVQMDEPEKAILHLNRALQEEAEHGPTLLNLMKAFFMAKRIEDGSRLASILKNDKDPYIAGMASAFLLSYALSKK